MLKKSLVALTMLSTFVVASEMELVLEVGRDNTELSAKSQAKIDTTESDTDKLINEFKVVSKQVEGLKLYNAQKRIQIQAQLDLMDQLDEQLVQVVVMQRQIPPLAQRMLESLESFISLDTPFRVEERQNRVDLVRASLAKPKVTASEQVRIRDTFVYLASILTQLIDETSGKEQKKRLKRKSLIQNLFFMMYNGLTSYDHVKLAIDLHDKAYDDKGNFFCPNFSDNEEYNDLTFKNACEGARAVNMEFRYLQLNRIMSQVLGTELNKAFNL